jgi:hypothetical protein
MDTSHDLFYWVTGTRRVRGEGNEYLSGLPFDESQTGVGNRDPEILGRPLWVVSSEGISRFQGTIDLVHVCNAGYFLHFEGAMIEPVPSLITSDDSMRCVYHAPVRIECLDPEYAAAVASWPEIPVVGVDWLGVVCSTSVGPFLHAFAHGDWNEECQQKAFCPLWSSGVSDPDSFYLALSCPK